MISRRDCLRSSTAGLLALSLGACKPTTAAAPATPVSAAVPPVPTASAASAAAGLPAASAATAPASAPAATSPASSAAVDPAAPFSVRSPIFVLNSLDATISIIDPVTMTETRRIPSGKEPHHLYLSPDEKSLLVANAVGNTITLVDPRTGQVQRTMTEIVDPYQLRFSPDMKWFVTAANRLNHVDIYSVTRPAGGGFDGPTRWFMTRPARCARGCVPRPFAARNSSTRWSSPAASSCWRRCRPTMTMRSANGSASVPRSTAP